MRNIKSFAKSHFIAVALTGALLLTTGLSLSLADNPTSKRQFPCAYLPADRATEFHGNAEDAYLRLGMAGNQWVVFDKVLQGFNHKRGVGNGTEPRRYENRIDGVDFWTLAKLKDDARDYYVQLIPPGQIRKQIKSGCLILGNDEERNFLPGNVQVDFDVFSSTNYNLMQDLANNGFVREAIPYIKNKLDLMVDASNSKGVGSAGAPGTYANIHDIVMDLLDPDIIVAEVDHVNEGIHKAINKMYQAMDEYIRKYGSVADIGELDIALRGLANKQVGSPSDTRPGDPAKYVMSDNPDCHYTGHATIPDGTLRLCEFSILNKANTIETRVHHVETPNGILAGTVHVGPVWVSELGYQLVRNVPLSGMDQMGGFAGVASPANANPVVNAPATYSIAVLATAKKDEHAQAFIDFVRSPEGQKTYTDGGFIGLTQKELNSGQCYTENGTSYPRNGGCD